MFIWFMHTPLTSTEGKFAHEFKTEKKFNCIKYNKTVLLPCDGAQSSEAEEGSCWQLLVGWCCPARTNKRNVSLSASLPTSWHVLGVFNPLPLVTQMWSLGLWLTHRLCLADQKLVELLQQGRLPYDLPAHVGVPGLLIRVPEEDSPQSGFNLNQCIFLVLGKTWYITSWEAAELRSSDHRFPAPEYPWNIFPSDNEGSPWHGWKKKLVAFTLGI